MTSRAPTTKRRPLLLAALLLATAAPLVAQSSVFDDAVDVRVVNLEVVVENKGERARGLTPDDFELEVDGQRMPIQFFAEVADGVTVNTVSAPEAGPAGRQEGEVVPTSYLVFIDEFFAERIDRNRALDGLIDQLPLLQVTDQMAVVAYDGQNVDMLSNWTGNVDELATTFTQAKERQTQGLKWRLEERNFESNRIRRLRDTQYIQTGRRFPTPTLDPLNPLNDTGLTVEERQFAGRIEDAAGQAVRSAAASLRGFSQPDGRKVLVLLSGGWPNDASRWVVPDIERRFERESLLLGDRILDPLLETANLLGYSIYAVDLPGQDSVSIDAAAATAYEAETVRELSRLREQEEEFAMLELADQTGGKALLDGSNRTAFAKIVEDTRTYYWIGFSPSWQENDSRHKVEVKVNRKGHKTRARRGFTDLSETTRVTMLTESALLFRDSPDALPLTASFGESRRKGIGKREVPLTVNIPVNEVTFLPTAEGFATELELRVAVIDDSGNRAEIPVVPITYETARLPEGQEVATYETSVLLRKKQHDVLVSLYDRASGKLLSTRLTLAEL